MGYCMAHGMLHGMAHGMSHGMAHGILHGTWDVAWDLAWDRHSTIKATSSLRPVSMGREQRAESSMQRGVRRCGRACSLIEVGFVEEVVDELLHHRVCVSENGGDEESGRALVCRHPVPD